MGIVTGFTGSGAAAGAQAATPPYDRGVVIEIPRDAPATVDLTRVFRRGTIFSVALYENASTGYLWTSSVASVPENAVVYLDTDYVADQVPPGTVGSGGTRYFRYQARNGGNAVITLRYQRSWEPQPIKQVTLNVTVR